MSKIFISHASADAKLVNALMDLIQNQFNLTREDFFNTSDEELTIGANWIEEIRLAMHEATLVMPIITPGYLESAFCLCELGSAWVNVNNLIPIIVPPLNYTALDATPYRRWLQTIQLDSQEGLSRLYDAINTRNIGSGANMTRFLKRVEDFRQERLLPFIDEMKQREVVSAALVKQLRTDLEQYKQAFDLSEDELKQLRDENHKLRKMKDAEEVKEMDYANMSEWEMLMEAVEKVKDTFQPLSRIAISVLYNQHKNDGYGFIADEMDKPRLSALESEGMAYWDSGWYMDSDHPYIESAETALNYLQCVMNNYEGGLKQRFLDEYPGVRYGLQYSPCWEALFDLSIIHSE